MSAKEVVQQENAVQAVLIADTFGDEFVPITDDIPLALLPLVNKPLIDYTLEFLSLGGVEEVFLFCSSHVDKIKRHVEKCEASGALWSLMMRVKVVVSESCRSLGDCLRDLDSKGLIRGHFVLLEPGIVSNVKLLPIIKKHNKTVKSDKGAAITLVFQEAGFGQIGRCLQEEVLLACDANDRVLYLRKLGQSEKRKIDFPLDIFLDNSFVNIRHNVKDTHIAICSPSVLPLFSDNFDFQTRDDFIRGLLMNEEILGSTIYWHLVRGSNYGSAVTNWRTYQSCSQELQNRWVYPILPPVRNDCTLKKGVVVGKDCKIADDCELIRAVIGDRVTVGRCVKVEDSFIMSDTVLEEDVMVGRSVIGPECRLRARSKILSGSILGKGVVVDEDKFVENALVQRSRPEDVDEQHDRLGERAYMRRLSEDSEDDDVVDVRRRLSRLHFDVVDEISETGSEDDIASDSEEALSYTQSPVPDDTKLFFTEVIDSLTRGFEDQLPCDNLILEINSSRYAYNVTVKEVNFNVIKAIFHMSLRQPIGSQYFPHLQRLLSYFSPILKNYIRNESAMFDCLQAVEDVATSNEELNEKWVTFVLNWFYDKDHLSEDAILLWFGKLDKNNTFYAQVKPFTDWLKEAEEASSSSEDEESE